MKKYAIIISFLFSSPIFSQLTIEQVRAEMDSVISSLSAIHPTFNDSPNKQALLDMRDTINNSMTSHELFKILQPLITLDGHTTLQFTGVVYPELANPLLPVETILYVEHLYVKNNLSSDTLLRKGTEILKINGQPVLDIISRMLPFLPGERIEYKFRKLDNEAFPNWYRLIYGNFERFEIEYKTAEGTQMVTVEGTHWKEFPRHEKDLLQLKMPDKDIAYIKIGKFRHPKEFLPFIDSAFTVITNQQIDNLILDITEGGGFTMLTDSLLSYLTQEPYFDFEKKMTRISRETKEFINEHEGEGEEVGDYFVITKKPLSPVSKPNQFHGKAFILTGPRAYSASTMFAAMAKCFTNAIIVGEETGQPLISNADIIRIKLPHSGMNLYTSLSTYYFPCAVNKQDGVKPDYEVRMTKDDLLNDTNRYLEFTIDLIKQDVTVK